MSNPKQHSWEHFKKYYYDFPTLGMSLDLSRVNFPEDFFATMETRIHKAFADMTALEGGAIANPDEGRMVGHYWLRNPTLAPTAEIRREIEDTVDQVKKFAANIHSGVLRGEKGVFKKFLLIGIGGSALGPQFVAHALGHPRRDKMRPYFFDNTDPDGMQRVLETIGPDLSQTICLVVSKSGGTKETKNGMLVAKSAYEKAGLPFERHALAITKNGSELHTFAVQNKWINTFPMWDWVGGRTSELSAVGLLPAALQGFDIGELLAGAQACDAITRIPNVSSNPAASLALTWFYTGGGRGEKNMVIIPYKDRLELLSRYLQQLIMESLGKRTDVHGNLVNQGISVFGNKGSTDQHSYIQQLIDGKDDFFLTLIEVSLDQDGPPVFVEPDITSGDYLHGFCFGTRDAVSGAGRDVLTIMVKNINEFTIGVLIGLFERAVGFYASMVEINAYHQPGVEAGKLAASKVLELQTKIASFLIKNPDTSFTIHDISSSIGAVSETEQVFRICQHLSSNSDRGLKELKVNTVFESRYRMNG